MDLSKARVEKREPLMIKDAKWITLVKTTFTGADEKTRTWESMERLTRQEGSKVDAVGILAILEKSTGAEILLQKQFRPPVDRVCVEIPAGLIDAGETAEACAVRELKEETGYVGKVVAHDGTNLSPVMFNDPGKLTASSVVDRLALLTFGGVCNTNVHVVRLSIDMDEPENQDPKPELEEDEFIETFSVPLSKLYVECQKLEKQGLAIDARVGTLAEGIELAKSWRTG